jgi:hypothetical protein
MIGTPGERGGGHAGGGGAISDYTGTPSPVDTGSQGEGDNSYTAAIRDSKGNITNPYPDGFFSRIFGAENVSYAGLLDQNQMAGIENMRYNRYSNPQAAVSKGFGSLFGGAEGEMTVAGPRVAQIQPATTSQSLAGIVGMGLGLPVGALSRAARTTYAPEGFLDEGSASPSAVSASSEFLTGVSPEAVGSIYGQAADLVDQAKEGIRSIFSDKDVDDVIDNLERPMDKYAGQRGRDLLAAQITPADLPSSVNPSYEELSGAFMDRESTTNDDFIYTGLGLGPRPEVDLKIDDTNSVLMAIQEAALRKRS